jgi:hypothetical protein
MAIETLYRKPNTSKPAPGYRICPYLRRGLAITRPNQVWAMDITYIPMARGFVYLAAVLDYEKSLVDEAPPEDRASKLDLPRRSLRERILQVPGIRRQGIWTGTNSVLQPTRHRTFRNCASSFELNGWSSLLFE